MEDIGITNQGITGLGRLLGKIKKPSDCIRTQLVKWGTDNERNQQSFQTKPVIDDLREGSFIKTKRKNKMLLVVPSIITMQLRQGKGTCLFYIFLEKPLNM